jgi:hypothetical protein
MGCPYYTPVILFIQNVMDWLFQQPRRPHLRDKRSRGPVNREQVKSVRSTGPGLIVITHDVGSR